MNDQPAGSLNHVFAYPPTAAGPRKKGANVDSDAQELAKLITVPDEFEASVIVSALEADGIRARADGGYVADFREGISAGVSVVVAQSDLVRATQVVDELRRHRGEVDWSHVDVDNQNEGERPA